MREVPRCLSLLVVFSIVAGSRQATAGTPTSRDMQYLAHWQSESDPWADMKLTITPPDDGATLPANAHVRLDTTYILGTRKDLFCHIANYFAFSLVTKVDSGSWTTLATKDGTTTGCPSASKPFHVVEFDIPLTSGDGVHSLEFHLYADGKTPFCPRAQSDMRASMRITGTIHWTVASGQLQTPTVVINDLEQPRELPACPAANAAGANSKYPERVVARPAIVPVRPLLVFEGHSEAKSSPANQVAGVPSTAAPTVCSCQPRVCCPQPCCKSAAADSSRDADERGYPRVVRMTGLRSFESLPFLIARNVCRMPWRIL